MAGMFMLPRFYAYHVEDLAVSGEMDKIWQQREARLMRIIINPAMIITWICGLLLAFHAGYWGSPWFLAKFLLVIGLSALHGMMSAWRKAFVRGTNTKSSRFFRLLNEVPTLATIPIVILVIVQPWN
jgi:protoporphyrinogen IX oxidase